jgi:flagellar hook-basal body complex protein FliE
MIAAIPLITSALSALAPQGNASQTAAGAAAGGADFGQVMAKVTSDAVQSLKKAETLSVQGIEGKADLQSVVQSVMSAQESLQTALALRDKSVAAYQEISRMSI